MVGINEDWFGADMDNAKIRTTPEKTFLNYYNNFWLLSTENNHVYLKKVEINKVNKAQMCVFQRKIHTIKIERICWGWLN